MIQFTINVRVPTFRRGRCQYADGRVVLVDGQEPIYLIRKSAYGLFQKATPRQAKVIRNLALDAGYRL